MLSETVTMMESMLSTVVRFDSSKVKASVVRRSSTRPMIRMGWMDELNCEVTDTTGVEVETEMLTIAVESLEVLIERPRAAHDHPSAHWDRGGCLPAAVLSYRRNTAHDKMDAGPGHGDSTRPRM